MISWRRKPQELHAAQSPDPGSAGDDEKGPDFSAAPRRAADRVACRATRRAVSGYIDPTGCLMGRVLYRFDGGLTLLTSYDLALTTLVLSSGSSPARRLMRTAAKNTRRLTLLRPRSTHDSKLRSIVGFQLPSGLAPRQMLTAMPPRHST